MQTHFEISKGSERIYIDFRKVDYVVHGDDESKIVIGARTIHILADVNVDQLKAYRAWLDFKDKPVLVMPSVPKNLI